MAPVIKAEVTLVSLKSCLVNLPPNLIALLSNSNTPPQNVIVELQYRSQTLSSGAVSSPNNAGFQRSAYVGWTGMPSRTRTASLLNDRARGVRDQEVQSVEIDAAFAKLLGLSDGSKVGLLIHLDPPVAHTVHIEPLTPSDWEIIELHATFLELNLLSQIRALPNPAHKNASQTQAEQVHPLTLHLSPNTTANIIVTSLLPALSSAAAFAKIAPDAEVIVAPKTRAKAQRNNRDARSTASRRSGKSAGSGATPSRKASSVIQSIFVRGVDAGVAREFAPELETHHLSGLKVWLSKGALSTDALRGTSFASITIVRPAGLRAQMEQTQIERLKEEENSDVGRPAAKIVARVEVWKTPSGDQHALLSPDLSHMLGSPGLCGLILRVEAAQAPLSRHSLKSFLFFPFLPSTSKKNEGLRFGGDTKVQNQALIDRLRITHGGEHGLLSGPLTDGMVLPPGGDPISSSSFDGGIIRFQKADSTAQSSDTQHLWVLGGEQRQDFEVRSDVPRPIDLDALFPTFAHGLPARPAQLIGVDTVLKQAVSNLTLCSSILLTGGIGSGKTAIAQWLGSRLREDYLFNVTYFSCESLVTDEIRVSAIKESLTRLFMSASWCARLGGQSVIILDDLDKICPVETELQVGNDNGRSRQVTEILCAIIRQYCSIHSGVALLATALSKDNLNSILIGGHVVGDIISLKAPTKEVRRDILSSLLANKTSGQTNGYHVHSRNPSDSNSITENSWMNPSNPSTRPGSSSSSHLDLFRPSPSLDLLDVAGKTDGYMPADLELLVSRARNECLIRTVSTTSLDQDQESSAASLVLGKDDFQAAIKNFTPTSLRNVTLTHSTTTFSSIGGLKSTRNVLLETLQYPTKYAPIFAASPLRLRSGLLLYGFPGCGKTLLASAVAGECGLNFISVKGPEILNKYIGASEKSVRDLFERAQAAKPCVLFFDEFDSIAPKRGHDSTGVTDRVVNQMLTQMDGAEGLDGVYVLAATSRPDLIDPALLRPGRLDKSLLCDMPDAEDREDILRAVSDKLNLTPEVKAKLSKIATRTEGFSGADLQALMYNAHLEAIHELLGDQSSASANKTKTTEQAQVNGTNARSQSSHAPRSTSRSRKSDSRKDDFIQFLYDPNLDAEARKLTAITSTSSDSGSGASLDPRAVIAAKLEEMKLTRKQEKAMMRESRGVQPHPTANRLNNGSGPDGKSSSADKKGGEDVVISWLHVERSLSTTRSSISPQERRRLEAIYKEFVVGRNGEMPSGDGGREIGGRSSLM